MSRKGGRARPDEPLADFCQAAIPGVCKGRATLRHHRQGRTPIRGVDVNDVEHTLDLCDPCHQYVHAHPLESYDRGWMIRRLGAA